MFQHKKISSLDDYFLGTVQRGSETVYFYRIADYSDEIKEFLHKYYAAAAKNGVIIEGGIPNPDRNNLSYYYEIMGEDFRYDPYFISESLKKWLPRMNDIQRKIIGNSIYDTLTFLSKSGKNENMLKNAYVKFMCWLYYKFERITNKLGSTEIPKILYEGNAGKYELLLLSVLSGAGCDIVMLEYNGDSDYLKNDPESLMSDKLMITGGRPFPENFSIKGMRSEITRKNNEERLCGSTPEYSVCVNSWAKGKGLSDALTPLNLRKNTGNSVNTVFYRINGTEDRVSYMNELISFSSEIKSYGRKLVTVNSAIPVPAPEEISKINRKAYNSTETAVADLAKNIIFADNNKLQQLMKYKFSKIFFEEAEKSGSSVNKLVNNAVYVLCWLKRYQSRLFSGWKFPDTACFILMGGCRSQAETLFIRLLSELPADVIILVPNLNIHCVLNDSRLKEFTFSETLDITAFPDSSSVAHVGTVAYHAERDLDTLMYQDTGIYRNRQYAKASSVVMKTTYEEIPILWNQELKYRPSFSTENGEVKIPVFLAKISGVKDRNINAYWQSVRTLITPDTVIIKAPSAVSDKNNPVKAHAVSFLKNGKLLRNKIKEHSSYQYGVLREEIQEHILDKLQLMLDSRIIKGTFEDGTEYTIISTVLNMNKDIVRRIQNFDFTRSNPKLIYINTGETVITPEEAIIAQFLSMVGFDVLFFIPTGYRNIEKYYSRQVIEEHQNGEYVYDLQIPDFSRINVNSRQSWRDKLFRRGV